MNIRFLLIMVLVIGVAGCTTTSYQEAINHLNVRVGQLEGQLMERDTQIEELRYEVSRLGSEIKKRDAALKSVQKQTAISGIRKIRDTGTIRINVSTEDVQKALKNAGYYNGAVDSKLGENTKRAIVAFQKDHKLTSDGIIGKKTWIELKDYLE